MVVSRLTHGALVETTAVVARTHRCEHCGLRFVHLDRGQVAAQHEDAITVSGDWVRDDALRKLRAGLKRFAEGPAWSEAACPGCERYQSDMVRRSQRRAASLTLTLALVVSLLTCAVGGVVAAAVRVPFTVVVALAVVGAVAILLTGALVGLATCLRSGSRRPRDPWAMEYDVFLEKCRRDLARRTDPILAWYVKANGELEDVTSLGIAGELPPGLEALSPRRMVDRRRAGRLRGRR